METPLVLLPTRDESRRLQVLVGIAGKEYPQLQEFKGIPYGNVPGRWEHASLATSLPSDVFEATTTGARCPQPSGPNNTNTFQSHLDFPADQTESEFDCLNLTITRPSPAALHGLGKDYSSARLPVLVWIHGGAYAFGSASDPPWDPRELVKKSIDMGEPLIVVGINYRLNIFGFFVSSEIMRSQSVNSKGGNFGICDQKLALIWVSQNITAFGGDPDAVTVGGQSAGASSVHSQTLDTVKCGSKRLFRHAIIQSGGAGLLGPVPLSEADGNFDELCKYYGIVSECGCGKVRALKDKSAAALVTAGSELSWYVFPLISDGHTISGDPEDCTFALNVGPKTEPTFEHDENHEPTLQVLVGDVEDEASIYKDRIAAVSSFDQLEQRFQKCFSASLTTDILSAFHIKKESTLSQLHSGIASLLAASLFHLAIHRIREGKRMSLASSTSNVKAFSLASRHGNRRAANIQTYRMRTGNPFPGVDEGVAHHCVDLIYTFNAFHSHLENIDSIAGSGILTPQSVSSEDLNEDPGFRLAEEQKKARVAPRMKISNMELSRRVSVRWIRFITTDAVSENELQDGTPAEITVYEKDGTIHNEDLINGETWKEERRRFELLCSKGRTPLRRALREITGDVWL